MKDKTELVQGSNCHITKSIEGINVHFICFNGHPVAKLFYGMKQDVMIPHHGIPTSLGTSGLDLSGWMLGVIFSTSNSFVWVVAWFLHMGSKNIRNSHL